MYRIVYTKPSDSLLSQYELDILPIIIWCLYSEWLWHNLVCKLWLNFVYCTLCKFCANYYFYNFYI